MRWSGNDPTFRDAVTITAPERSCLLRELETRLASGTGFSVATLNLDHVVKLRSDPLFRDAYRAQTHVTADGRPVVWLSRLAGRRVDLVTGSDLVEPVAGLAARLGVPAAMIGSSAWSLDAAAAELARRFPGFAAPLRIAPPMGFDPAGAEADRIIAEIRAARVGICFLALGAPKQEVFAARAARTAPEVGFLSIGAGLDFVSGAQRRAPKVVRAVAAEWLWRLLRDPRRLAARYAACAAVLPGLTLEALRSRTGAGEADA
jgi:exopolysaccharide biosynthesis WecB/TagA/CpsF family protein